MIQKAVLIKINRATATTAPASLCLQSWCVTGLWCIVMQFSILWRQCVWCGRRMQRKQI